VLLDPGVSFISYDANMFRLRSPPVVVSQQEHARLSGELARRWGNEQFDRPALDFEAFVRGVTLHDWHYGEQDTLPLDAQGASSRGEPFWREWLAIHARSETLHMDDPVVEAVAKMHIRRLLDDDEHPSAEKLRTMLDAQLVQLIESTGIARSVFGWADKITCACDLLAFYVFREDHTAGTFEAPTTRGTSDTVSIRFSMETGKRIEVDPWPFGCEAFELAYVAYKRELYPETSQPVPMRLRVGHAGTMLLA
jgi:uncharacterized protein DUF3891